MRYKGSIIKKLLLLLLLFVSSIAYAGTTPMTITFEAQIATQRGGKLSGTNIPVKVELLGRRVETSSFEEVTWTGTFDGVTFQNGFCSIVLGTGELNNKAYTQDMFDLFDPRFRLTIDGKTATFPVPSTPYAIQAKTAEEVLSIDASRITGEFVSTVNINADLIVDDGTLFVNATDKKVGVGTTTPQFKLDVDGAINADSFKIAGVDLESALSWKKNSGNLYYNEGNVGIATSNPQYKLEVVGTINATEYFIRGERLQDFLGKELSWEVATDEDDIYFDGGDDGGVGIGTSQNITERLVVDGAIRVGNSTQSSPQAGTIEFDSGDFWGYTSQGVKQSLTGIRAEGTPQSGEVTVWNDVDAIEGFSNFVFRDNNLGLGETTPIAKLHVKADSSDNDIVKIIDNDDFPALVIDSTGRVGIGRAAPTQQLDVNGIVDADEYYIDGLPMQSVLSNSSFWQGGNDSSVFYDFGNVGIGTNNPANLLEIATVGQRAAITFDINRADLFTMGVDAEVPEAFIISKGGDLDTPVFVFNDDRIGVGLKEPQANLHVSGNSGLLVTGAFGQGDPLPQTGPGTRMLWYPKKSAFRTGTVSGAHWDDANLGEYSIAMGTDVVASGEGAVALGGVNTSAGDYSVSLGLQNEANGSHSFAGGRQAIANHSGTFVWSDNTPTSDAFESTAENQFLIMANGGVGIGTNDTEDAALTVHRNDPGQHLLLLGSKSSPESGIVGVTTEGQVGIGTRDPGDAKLAVMGGHVGIGTTSADALLSINAPGSYSTYAFAITSVNAGVPVMVIDTTGNVGIGVTNPRGRLDVGSGDIQANQFLLTDPNDPNSVIILQPSQGSPWADPSDPVNNNNTYRAQGKVGIGTPSPNSLLELSNRSITGESPIITFDIDGEDSFSMGLVTDNNNQAYFTVQTGGTLTKDNTHFVMTTENIGIGTGLYEPSANLHVAGTSIFENKIAIGTTNLQSAYDVNIDGPVHVNSLRIAETLFTPQPSPWRTNILDIYYTSGNVGIGTSLPSERLEVFGTISTNRLIIDEDFTLEGDLLVDNLNLRDISGTIPTFGLLFVEDAKLKFRPPGELGVKVLSSTLERADEPGGSGPLAFWKDDSTIGRLPLFWNDDTQELAITGNLSIQGFRQELDGFSVTSDVMIGENNALNIQAILNHRGIKPNSSFTGQNLNVTIQNDWGHENSDVVVKGMDINLSQGSGQFLNRARAVGLSVDVSDINLTDDAKKFAAIFLGGNVGIGTTEPRAAVEVNGVVSANFFNLTGGLNVPQLTVNQEFQGFSADKGGVNEPLIGIGTLTPAAALDVHATVSANAVAVRNGLSASTINIGANNFVVDAEGKIGIGTDTPNGQIEVQKQISSTLASDFTAEKISIILNAAQDPGFSFEFNRDLTGLDVDFDSIGSNLLGGTKTATGISVDLSDIQLASGSKAVGLDIDVTGESEDAVRYAALFNGGYVGIGTTQPQADLHVVGDIKADNLFLLGNLQASTATFNRLTVNQVASINAVTLNRLTVLDTITANAIQIDTALVAPEATFTTLNAQSASINGTLRANILEIADSLSSKTASFLTSLGVGRAAPAQGLAVSGNAFFTTAKVTEQLTLESATVNINNGDFFIGSAGRLGLGTTEPAAVLHVETSSSSEFDPANNLTWNAIRLQNTADRLDTAVGLLLVPDSTAPSASIGSGIVGIRASEDQPGSSLAFVTDPVDSTPLERMRISPEGFVGIGTSLPTALLHVDGDALFEGTVTVNGVLGVAEIHGDSGLTIDPNGTLVIEGVTSVNNVIKADKSVFMKELALDDVPQEIPGYGILYVDAFSKDLIYLKSDATTRNITKAFTGTPNRVPFIDANGNLSSSAPLTYTDSTNALKLEETLAQFNVVSTVNAAFTGVYDAHKVNVNIENRGALTGADNTLTGMNLVLKSSPTFAADNLNFGRLADGETAIGLNVDVTDVIANYSFSGTQFSGYKYAATFQGGNVGVGTAEPQAALHVSPEATGTPFRVDVKKLDDTVINNALVVADNGFVGIGEASPTAQLTIKSSGGATDAAFFVKDENDNPLLYVRNDGRIGIGTVSPTEKIHVEGVMFAQTASVNFVEADTINIGSGAFTVNGSGQIGVGTTAPQGNIEFSKVFTDNVSRDPFTSQQMTLEIKGDSSLTDGGSFALQKDVTGLDININSQANNTLGDTVAGISATATGMNIDMSSIVLRAASKVVGLNVDVTAPQGSAGKRFAGIFNGGFVGVGTASPTVALDVVGEIKGTNLSLTGDLQAGDVTFNTVTVQNDVTVADVLTTSELIADLVSANSITVADTLSVATASFTTLEASNFATFNRVGIGVLAPQNALDVSGNVFVTGNMTLSGSLAVNDISHATRITLDSPLVSANGTFFAKDIARVQNGLQLSAGGTPQTSINFGQLFIDDQGDLNYVRPSTTTPINISSSFTGDQYRIPFYSTTGSISSTANMFWDSQEEIFRLGATDALTRMSIDSTLNNATAGDVELQSIDIGFGVRTQATQTVIKGLSVVFASENPTDPFNFGRLADGETAIGLHVDVDDLVAKYSQGLGLDTDTNVNGIKYAAVFQGGNVGIGTDAPQALLHVNPGATGSAFRVDVKKAAGILTNTLLVDEDGFIGLNTDAPDSRLSIKRSTDKEAGLKIFDATATRFFVSENVGIGTDVPSASLHVLNSTGKAMVVDTVGKDDALVVLGTGLVGVGVETPAAQLHVEGTARFDATGVDNALVIKPNGHLGIHTTTTDYKLNINGLIGIIQETPASGSLPPWITTDSGRRGVLTHAGSDFMYAGLRNVGDDFDPVIAWGDDKDDALKFQHYVDGTTTLNIMTLIPEVTGQTGLVGINQVDPQASLHVEGTFNVSNASVQNLLVATANGKVGIGTTNPAEALDVNGSITAKELNITDGNVVLSTLNVQQKLSVERIVDNQTITSGHSFGQKINMNLKSDVNQNVVGLDIAFTADPNLALGGERDYTIWNASAYGIKVDVTDVEVQDPTLGFAADRKGYKYAAAFTGGPVGIGTDRPQFPLHVRGPYRGALAKFGSSTSELVIRDYDEGRVGLNVIDVNGAGVENRTLTIARNTVGIGVTNPDKTLVVNGDVRLGVIKTTGTDPAGYGNKLYFSGGPRLTATVDGDNGDELYIARYNKAENVSELHVNIGDGDSTPGEDRFIVGFKEDGTTFKDTLIVQNDGKVGIVTDVLNFVPQTTLHVKGKRTGAANQLSAHVSVIENKSTEAAHTLAIYHSGLAGNIAPTSNFITFMNASTVLGEIEGNGSTGVRYKTNGGDYAEYLQKTDLQETIEKGDIVGVINGKISLDTSKAQQLLVRSTNAAVAGNWPGDDKTGYELIAFFGQVKIKVLGKVNKGDYILPSGKNNGTGIAVAPEKLLTSQRERIVGRAWESSSIEGLKKIHAAVGFNFSMPSFKEDMSKIESLETELVALKDERLKLDSELNKKLDKQNAELQRLMQELKALKTGE